MRDVDRQRHDGDNANNRRQQQQMLWPYANTLFGMEPNCVHATRRHLQQHSLEIARDNLIGQCTTGHGC